MARPKTMAKKKIINLPDDLTESIKDYWHAERLPNESEAIRQLIEIGLRSGQQADELKAAVKVLRAVAREMSHKAGADQDVIDAINSLDVNEIAASPVLRQFVRSIPELEKVPYRAAPEIEEPPARTGAYDFTISRAAMLRSLSHVTSVIDRRGREWAQSPRDPNRPTQPTPKRPKKP